MNSDYLALPFPEYKKATIPHRKEPHMPPIRKKKNPMPPCSSVVVGLFLLLHLDMIRFGLYGE
jgi:hypothetical protein